MCSVLHSSKDPGITWKTEVTIFFPASTFEAFFELLGHMVVEHVQKRHSGNIQTKLRNGQLDGLLTCLPYFFNKSFSGP